ncbi:phosphoheptose isomerase [Thermomonospora amylolytica]|uniref:phosphoheptose isomerase n=1 Tax=Thermomonospora amylolytica TaxID=1411117 RepID=UPI0018E59184|nr:phosphoheptose isomerase [Thermomonospora amylolytica]
MAAFDVMTGGGVLDAALRARERLAGSGLAQALAGRDPRPWGRRADERARLGWLDLPKTSRMLVDRLAVPAAEARRDGLDHVALIAVGPEGLAARAVAEAGGAAGDALTVLDGGDPAALERTLRRLDRTLVVLASKAGVSIEGDAHRRILVQAFRELGLGDAEIAARFLVITDHGSPLHGFADGCGYRVGLTDPGLPGHFGALSAYGLVPAMLAGADVTALLDQAAAALSALGPGTDGPGLLLGAVLGGCARPGPGVPGRDKVVLLGPDGLVGWLAQLVATGTGGRGRGILPLEPAGRPDPDRAPDVHTVALGGAAGHDADTSVWGPPGAQFLVWEYATAVAAWLLDVDPFDEGAVWARRAEEDAAAMLRRPAEPPAGDPDFVDGGVEVRGGPASGGWFGRPGLRGALDALLDDVPPAGYLAVVGHLPGQGPVRRLAAALARRSGRPVACGTGPGHLHGTGSFHMDGPRTGAFLVLTGEAAGDRVVPGRPYTLGGLRTARALADVRALRRQGLPVLWLHLRDPAADAARLVAVITGGDHRAWRRTTGERGAYT